MGSRKWLVSTLQSAVVLGALSGCGEKEDSSDKDRPVEAGMMIVDASADAGPEDAGLDSSEPSFDANAYVPPADVLPELPPQDPSSGWPSGAQVFGNGNPIIYLNDYPDSVYTDAYIYALATTRARRLVGVISTGIDCQCSAGDNVESSPRRQEWIEAAREAGFTNVPNNTPGTWGLPMVPPTSGRIADTARIPSAGADLIVAEAKLATREEPLVIVSGGPITTLADAYLKDPTITQTIVVTWLVGSFQRDAEPELSLTTNYRVTDPWAAEIVLRHFRVFIYPTDLDPPIISECRIDAEIPPSTLRELLFGAGYFTSGRDADGAPAIMANFPGYMKEFTRVSMAPTGLSTISNPNGNIWVMRKGDAEAGGNEFFQELRKAYNVQPDAGSFASPDGGGCMP
jgi:hypothetical protein